MRLRRWLNMPCCMATIVPSWPPIAFLSVMQCKMFAVSARLRFLSFVNKICKGCRPRVVRHCEAAPSSSLASALHKAPAKGVPTASFQAASAAFCPKCALNKKKCLRKAAAARSKQYVSTPLLRTVCQAGPYAAQCWVRSEHGFEPLHASIWT